MSEARSLVNMIGNAVATVVMAAWEGELDRDRLRLALDGRLPPAERQLPPVVVPALNRATVSNRG
jgi:aerobic C4-dicarboxylate transport protein